MNMYVVMRLAAHRLLGMSIEGDDDYLLALELLKWSKSNNPIKQEKA